MLNEAEQAQKFNDTARIIGTVFYHPTLKDLPWDRMVAAGYSYHWAGENIAAASTAPENAASAAASVTSRLSSPASRR